jgi:hypothetical protein
VEGWRVQWTAASPPTELMGDYGVGLQHEHAQGLPEGSGFARFSVGMAGAVRVVGRLADGVSFTTSTAVGPQGQVLDEIVKAYGESV